MQYTNLPDQPYTQVSPTPVPLTHQDQCAEYDAVQVGACMHWFDGWTHHSGTIQWAAEWRPDSLGRLNERARLVVVAVPESVNTNGVDSYGGLFLLNIQRWTDHLYRPAGQELFGRPLPALDEMHEEYHVADIACTGIRYRSPVQEFLDGVLRRHEAERSLDRAIAEQSSEETDR